MKNIYVTFISFLFLSTTAFSQTCSTYYPFNEGTKFEITSYNKKGKTESKANYKVSNVADKTATINAKIFDNKGKEITTLDYNIDCDENGVSIDFKSLMNPQMFEQYKDMEVDFEGINVVLPNNISVGDKLEDANMIMTIKMSGMNMAMEMKILDRTVVGKESITTAAGTFDCFAITYTTEMKMGIKSTFKMKEWIAKGVGLVKSENYNKSGKLTGYSELTSLSK